MPFVALGIVCGWLAVLMLARRQFVALSLIGFPGVFMHELMHWLVGVLLIAKPSSMNLIPKKTNRQWQLGSVTFSGLNLFNAAPVAFAPLLLLGVAWVAYYYWLNPALAAHHYPSGIMAGYVIACCMYFGLPSSTDLKAGLASAIFWSAISLIVWWLFFSPYKKF